MRPDGTIDTLSFTRDMWAATSREDRAARIQWWITAATATVVACGDDTTKVLNASAAVLWLRRQLDLLWKGV